MSNNTLPDYCIDDNKLYRLERSSMVVSYVEVPDVPKMKPVFYWTGTKIPLSIWRQILGFFQWSYTTHKSESQVRLHYNIETNEWCAWAHLQYSKKGMTTEEVPADDSRRDADNARFGNGWVVAGTVHHHCSTTAFQSPTDHADEIRQSGLHITVGKIDQVEFDLHGRVSHNHAMLTANWLNWFELPEGMVLAGMPYAAQAKILETCLKARVPDDLPFPEEWKVNIIEKKYESTGSNWQGSGGANTTYHGNRSITTYPNSANGNAGSSPSGSGRVSGNVGDGFGSSPTKPEVAPQNCWHTPEKWLAIAINLRKWMNSHGPGRHHAISWAAWVLETTLPEPKHIPVTTSEEAAMKGLSDLVLATGFIKESFARWCMGRNAGGDHPGLRPDCGASTPAYKATEQPAGSVTTDAVGFGGPHS